MHDCELTNLIKMSQLVVNTLFGDVREVRAAYKLPAGENKGIKMTLKNG